MAKFLYVEWLALWLIESKAFHFEWDVGNSTKSVLKHSVSSDEVEEVFQLGTSVPLGIQISPPVNEDRLAVVGNTSAGKILTIVFTIRKGKVRPISSRQSNEKEKKIYEALRKI